MNAQNFTEKSIEALNSAQRIAKERGNQALEMSIILLEVMLSVKE